MTLIPTIGLEVHVQLKTRSKMFCGCAVEYGAEPNTRTCPVCLGYPGALPVMNKEALEMTALTGLMLGCVIPAVCKFDRKNYFYPDMPKNYQITQFDQPICQGGGVPLDEFAYPKDVQKNIKNPGKVVRLTRIHLEEDVAKSQHFESNSGIDFNRAGTPLMEIVSEPDIATPEEAFAYLTALQQILIYGGVSDADMEKGQLRCDCNISVAPAGAPLGTKIEIKNMNSISAVRRALAYEIERQIAAVEKGETLVQSTRRWDDDAGRTYEMRKKESSHDYRYFPDPDLLPVDTSAFMNEVRSRCPELPHLKRKTYEQTYNLSPYDASVLTSFPAISGYFDSGAPVAQSPKLFANLVTNQLLGAVAVSGMAPSTINSVNFPVSPKNLAELSNLQFTGVINSSGSAQVFAQMFATGQAPEPLVVNLGLKQESDTGAIEALCRQAIENSPKAVAEYKSGKTQAINAIKGQVMKLSKGKANPTVVGQTLERLLAS